jgi:GAF domain
MARYEVFVPAAPPRVPMDLTLRLEADHWLGALKTGLKRLGEAHPANNVLCDIQADGSIHVTDPDSGRVFRIIEIPAITPVGPMPAVVAAPPPAVAPPAPAQAKVALTPVPAPVPEARREPLPPAASKPVARPSGHAEHVVEHKTPIFTPAHPIGRMALVVKDEDVLAELFMEAAEMARITDRKAGLGFALDAAMRIIGCEAGSVFTADLGRKDLSFEVVRGPSADKLKALGLRVPIGTGIVGFCAQEDVCVAVSDVEKDSRFYRAVSEATGYQTRSLLCAPMARHGQVVGCLEVLNKKGPKPFDQKDLAVLSYLAAQATAFLSRIDA